MKSAIKEIVTRETGDQLRMMILTNTNQSNGLLNHFPDLNYFQKLHRESALLGASEEAILDLRTIC